MNLRIATSQFSVSSDIKLNTKKIIHQIKEAAKKRCAVIHFPEGSLSGYAGVDFNSFEDFNWELLREKTSKIMSYAKKYNIWVVLGSSHQLSKTNKPHNSLYIISNEGNIIDRYDKLFCAGNDTLDSEDLAHYTPGDHFTIFTINEIKCSALICHDYRYPELYRELKQKGVELIFHSFNTGGISVKRLEEMQKEIGKENFKYNNGKTYPEITMPSTMIAYAGSNYVWISSSNNSAKESCWGSFMVRPDGVIIGKLKKNRDGILISEIDTTKKYYDSTKYWRDRAINGIYHSGEIIDDPKSQNRREL